MMRVDSHHHLLMPRERHYDFTDHPVYRSLQRGYDVDDLRSAVSVASIDATVVVETILDAEETERLLEIAGQSDLVAGVVGWVDLTSGQVADEIARLRGLAHGSSLCGIRHLVHDEPDPNWLVRNDVLSGLRDVAAAGLPYDLLIRPRELAASTQLARQLPELPLVVDHIAKPEVTPGETLDPVWRAGLEQLARESNVYCKLSGMVTEAGFANWRADELTPYMELALEWFGPARLMFGSDWPVCLLGGSYADVYGIVGEFIGKLSESEQAQIMGGTAAGFYGLN